MKFLNEMVDSGCVHALGGCVVGALIVCLGLSVLKFALWLFPM